MRKNMRLSRKISISRIVIIFMVLLIVFQGILFVSVTTVSGTGRQIEMSSFSYIAKNLSYHRLILERYMSEIWGNIDNLYAVINNAKNDLSSNGIESQINLTKDMLNAVQILKASGITIVWYGESKDTVISLMDYNPSVAFHNNSDSTLFYGDRRIARNLGIKIDQNWSAEPYEDDLAVFKEYKEKAEKLSTRAAIADNKKVSSWEYYKNSLGDKYWNCLIPLIDNERFDPIGFLLVKVDLSMVMESLYVTEDTDPYIKGYALLRAPTDVCEIGESVEFDVMGVKMNESVDCFRNSTVKMKRVPYDYEEDFRVIDSAFVMDGESAEGRRYEHYLANVSFINSQDFQDYYVLIMVDRDGMNLPVKEFKDSILFIFAGFFAIGTFLTVLLGYLLSVNASKVTQQVRKLQKNEGDINFQESSIYEFDMLLEEIRILRVSLKESADKFESIFALSDFPIVALEIDEKADSVYKVGRIFDVLDNIENYDGETDDFVKEVTYDYYVKFRDNFLRRYQKYLSYMNDDDTEVTIWETSVGGQHKYIKIATDVREKSLVDFSSAVRKNAAVKKVVLKVITECTHEILEQNKIKEERDRDALTGLLNRFSFRTKIESIVKSGCRKAAMLMWDLDDLKFVNDAYGHDSGDLYIRAMADLIRRLEDENSAVARISGDEFFAFVPYTESKEEIRAKVREIREQMKKSELYFADEKMSIHATAGVAWYPDDTSDLTELYKYADFAMYTAKNSIKGSIAEFNRESFDNNYIVLVGNQYFERFIREKQVKFAYQPIVSSKSGEVIAYEALMRPTSEHIKTVSTVLRIARQQHRLPDVELLTIEMVLKFISENEEILSNRKVFVNSIANIALAEDVIDSLNTKYGNQLSKCVVEIIEDEDVESECIKIKQDARLRLSMQLAIDNYGNGYSNRVKLNRIQPDYIKIDMNLIRGVERDGAKIDMIRSIVDNAKKIGILTVCEGVETFAEMKTLIQMGVDYLQGFYVGKPEFGFADIDDKIKEEIKQLSHEVR